MGNLRPIKDDKPQSTYLSHRIKFLNEFLNYSFESEYKLVPDELIFAASSVAANLRVFMGERKISPKKP